MRTTYLGDDAHVEGSEALLKMVGTKDREKDGLILVLRGMEGFCGCARVDGRKKKRVSAMDYCWSSLQACS